MAFLRYDDDDDDDDGYDDDYVFFSLYFTLGTIQFLVYLLLAGDIGS